MAQKYVVQVVDDLDGTELGADEAEEVRFGLDGRSYVIDLSTGNAGSLRDTLRRYVDAARGAELPASRTNAKATAGEPAASRRSDLHQVRKWANANGYPVSSPRPRPGSHPRRLRRRPLTRLCSRWQPVGRRRWRRPCPC